MNNLKKFRLPIWFPYPISCLKAVILAASMMIFFMAIKLQLTGTNVGQKLGESEELLICSTILFLLFLIPIFAFLHHFIQLLFRIFRQIFNRQHRYKLFWFPEFRSWWKALYSWLVIIISTLTAILVYTLLLPWFDLSYKATIFARSNFFYPQTFPEKLLLFVFILIWMVVAAKLYHIEFLSAQFLQLHPATPRIKKKSAKVRKSISPEIQKIPQKQNNRPPIKPQTNFNQTGNELAKYSSNYGVNQIPKTHIYTKKINQTYHPYNNYQKKLQKIFKENILILLIIPVLGLAVYGFSRWQLVSETPVVVVTKISSPVTNQLNSQDLEVEPTTIQSALSPTPITESSPISSETIVLPPPDPFKLAVNRAMNAAEMAQSAKSTVEWEAVASQWQDATELMKIVPASHPQYTLARKKIQEYQSYSDYAQRVVEISSQ